MADFQQRPGRRDALETGSRVGGGDGLSLGKTTQVQMLQGTAPVVQQDAAQGSGVRDSAGKATATMALQRKAVEGAPSNAFDVSDVARAEVGSAFGAAAQGVAYQVGGGTAEARGANAITTGGKVDFAPGQFDLESHQGRARLGEETAHAVQQSNPGETSSVASLEGEAKQAGEDFASGHAPKVERAAPRGLALADDPKDKDKAAKDTDPSTEVPDLTNGEVAAIKKVITSNQAEALGLVLKALQRIDATKFSSKDLTDGKLHAGSGSSTIQGPKFQAWIETTLDAYAKTLSKKRADLSASEVKKALQAAPVPAASKDITVTIGSGHFASVSLLYSTVRHEFVHVEQIRADFVGYIPSELMPSGVDSPSDNKTKNNRELEAYQWEMEHLASTGLKETGELYLLWDKSSDAWQNASADAQKKVDPAYGKAFNNVWKLAMDGHIAALDEQHKAFKKSGKVSDESAVFTLQQHLKMMWNYRDNFGNKWSGSEAGYKAALAQSEEMLGNGAAEEFKKAIDKADASLKTGITDAWAAYSTWFDLLNLWIKLDATISKTYEARFQVTAPALWDKAFTLYEAKINAALKAGEVDDADTLLYEKIGTLFMHASKSSIKEADYAKRKKALEDAVKKAKKP
jgi:Domain of unknown function (DUF4157)